MTTRDRTATAAAVAVLLLGALEAALAWSALGVAAGRATCPDVGPAFGCAAIARPRVAAVVGQVGPSHLAFLGGMATLALGLLLLAPPPAGLDGAPGRRPPALALWGGRALAAGAGLAVGIQPLGWLGGGAVCPLCLALALCALLACGAALVAGRGDGSPRGALVALVVTAALVAPPAWLRGRAIAAEDAVRLERAWTALRAPRAAPGPRVVLVLKEGCPHCHGLLVDVLADARVQAALERAGAVEVVAPGSPGARALGLSGAPVLAVVGRDGRLRGEPIAGYRSDAELYARWLEERLSP